MLPWWLDNLDCSLYLNGSVVARTELKSSPPDTDYPTTVGDWGSPDRPFTGQIEEVRITHRTLSAREIFATAKRSGVIRDWPLRLNRVRLPKDPKDLVHIGFDHHVSDWQIPGVKAAPAMIELIVRPGPKEVPGATLVTNQSQDRFQGFALQRSADGEDKYELVLGYGKSWMAGGQFTLTSGVAAILQ